MSQVPDQHEEAHTGPIKTPKQMLVMSVLGFLLPVLIIVGLVYFVTLAPKPSVTESSQEQVAERIAKIGSVKLGVDPSMRVPLTGDVVYKAQCATCHDSGLAGAPKFGEAAAWASRLPSGLDALVQSALKGKGSMAPQGGGDYTDFEITRAVVHMLNQAGGNFKDPAPPAPAPSAQQVAAAASEAEAQAKPTPASAPLSSNAPVAKPAASSASAASETVPLASAEVLGPEVGKAVYDQACQICHAAGVAGAPKLGDKAAWKPRLGQGVDALTSYVITGKGAMPPRGASTASDKELKAAVQFMVDASK